MSYADFHRRSIDDRDGFWSEQAKLIDWQTPFETVCDYSDPPFARWFVGGKINLCHNAQLITQGFRLGLDSVSVFWLPLYHDMGLIGGVLQPMQIGR